MKKFVTASLFVFMAIISGVAVVGLISVNSKNNQPLTVLNADNTNEADKITGVGSIATTLTLSNAELAKHNSANSCWLLIFGKIYDVTSFINSHPGGDQTILQSCGTDATAAFATKGGVGTHSSSANAMLADYYIGDLNQTVTTNPTNPANPPVANPNPTPPRSRGDDDDEFDD